ncbi:DUF5634 family protein [Alkalihalobacterium bogoriense]|uniref:DUF5634 family protein n=1 Tax=Alkalihalobacterium bogoriense TaxID=246272 RepID=UPI00047E4596|nr:DUF5634 family protein [Alkalihalobacterium bogoriense]
MESVTRETILQEMNDSLERIMNKYDVDDIGIFEEQGEAEEYYIGYTIRKADAVFMVHRPFYKDEQGLLAPHEKKWTVEFEDGEDFHGFSSLDEAMDNVSNGIKH